MANNFLRPATCSIIMLIFFTCAKVSAQTPTRMGPAPAEEIAKALVKVEANMDSLKAHRNYIFAMGMKNPLLLDQYEAWMKQYPGNVNIPLAIGTVFFKAAMPQPRDFLLRAAAMDPKNAQIWYMLGIDADLGSQNELVTRYMEKAMSIEPSNVGYAYGYLKSFESSDPEVYKKKAFEFAKQFPEDQRGAYVIYQLGQQATNLQDKIHYFEALRKAYPPEKFKWSTKGMIGLADAYLQTDPGKALALSIAMGEGHDWEIRKQVAESLISINQLEKDKNYKDALLKLNQVKLPGYQYNDDFISLRKAALREKAGDIKMAYDSLAAQFAKSPTDALYSTLESYGNKLGKSKDGVDQDIDIIRYSEAVPAFPFKLGLYTSDKKLDLKALRGKVVLLTFWFPGCLPCREEFPHFQTVVDTFKNDSLVYLGINVIPSQDGYVLPFMENTKYSFIPLRGSFAFSEENYGVSGAPANFLIDKNGKIVFKDFRTGSSNHRTLEMMITSLLEKD